MVCVLCIPRHDEVLISFDVTTLFASVPGKEWMQMAIRHAKIDTAWSNRMVIAPEEFGELQMVVDTTYFRFNGRIYEQTYGIAVDSPLSPVLANLFVEEFSM